MVAMRGPMRPTFRRLALAWWFSAVAVACSEASGPSGGAALDVIAGGGRSDTVAARPLQALVVRLRGTDGRPVAGEVVRFETLQPDSAAPGAVLVSATGASAYGPLLADTTNASGEASALLVYGWTAGTARLGVSSPRFGIQDTVTFTVLPGAATMVVAAPADTAVYVGHGFALRGYVADVYGNPRTDPLTFTALDAGITVAGTQVTGAFIGRSAVRASAAGNLTATLDVSVVPQGTIAAVSGWTSPYPESTIVMFGLDGSGAAAVPQSAAQNNYLQWSPAGTSILHYRPMFAGHTYTLTLGGVLTRLVPAGAGFAEDNWARVAANGSWVYFRGARGYPGTGYIWRIHPDGSGLDSVPVDIGTQPSPSPDGSRVAYAAGDGRIHVYTYGLGDADLGIPGWAPHWSPDGAWIAFISGAQGEITIVAPDGSGGRSLAAAGTFDWCFDWSPDSRWLVVAMGGISLVDVQTAARLPLAFTGGLHCPTWRP